MIAIPGHPIRLDGSDFRTVSALLLGGRQALSTMTHVEVEGLVTRP